MAFNMYHHYAGFEVSLRFLAASTPFEVLNDSEIPVYVMLGKLKVTCKLRCQEFLQGSDIVMRDSEK